MCLHNYLMNVAINTQADSQYFNAQSVDREDRDGNIIDGDWRNEENHNLITIRRTGTNMYSRYSENIRSLLSTYFMNEGAVPFQWNK